MKKAITLILIYLLMQLLGSFTAMPLALLWVYLTTGEINLDAINRASLVPALLLGIAYMGAYLWRKGYLKNDGFIYSPLSPAYLGWCAAAGASTIVLIDALMTQLTFLPDLMRSTFDVMQSGWPGILALSLIGPILEEMLFRGGVTRELVRHYPPSLAILLSALIFGVFHINPVQVVSAFFSGLLLAWIYYKSRSLVPCILIHVINNSFSVWSTTRFPDADYLHQLMPPAAYAALLAAAVALLLLSLYRLKRYVTMNVEMYG